jgi:hypothetical protein
MKKGKKMKNSYPLISSLLNENRIMRLNRSIDILIHSEKEKQIRNTDYQQVKKDLGYVVEAAFDNGLPKVDCDDIPEYMEEIYWKSVCSTNDLLNASKKLEKMKEGFDHPYVIAYKTIVDELKPICEKVKEAKIWVVKGRVVKEKSTSEIIKEQDKRTCPCCFGRFSLHNGKMVHHGFQRPGTGYQTESCFGFGYEPFERSNLGTLKIVEYLENILKEKELILPRMKEDKVILLLNEKTRKFFEVKLGDENFEKENNRRILEVERDIKVLKKDITFYNEKLKNWQKTE